MSTKEFSNEPPAKRGPVAPVEQQKDNVASAGMAVNGPDIEDEIVALAKLSELDYARKRGVEAKTMGILVTTLDRLVKERRKKAEEAGENIIPWPGDRVRSKKTLTPQRDGNGLDWPEKATTGVKARSQPNVEFFLRHTETTLSFNELSNEVIIHRTGKDEVLSEDSFNAIFLEADKLGLQGSDKYFFQVFGNIARRKSFHPIRDYLDGLEWDGVSRLDEWLSTYLKAENTALNTAFGRKLLIAAARRVRQPGVKFDTILILQGKQGHAKSSALQTLCPDEKYFTDSLTVGADQKEIIELTAGKWIVELPELDGMGKRDAATIKSMASRQVDKARLSYGRMTSERPRQFVLIGTVNECHYLRDMTGNRRFWPVTVYGECDLDGIKKDRDLLWAEAAYYEAQGESLTLPRELWAAAAEAQRKRMLVDPWEEILSEHLEYRNFAFNDDIYEVLGVPKERRSGQVGQRVCSILTGMGFERGQRRDADGKQKGGYKKVVTGDTPVLPMTGNDDNLL